MLAAHSPKECKKKTCGVLQRRKKGLEEGKKTKPLIVDKGKRVIANGTQGGKEEGKRDGKEIGKRTDKNDPFRENQTKFVFCSHEGKQTTRKK